MGVAGGFSYSASVFNFTQQETLNVRNKRFLS